jgi:UDP-N-acetylglucosamine--N-acetylmuramyl-(pentapeptide) pyrophosphoryl-undecaprenol N-acetylglucosamine transferase
MRVLIAGGGTGGHLYPGIAIAEEVTARPGGEVLFVGTARGLEARAVPAAGYPLELLQVSGLKRMGLGATLRGLGRLPGALGRSLAILRRFRPDVVLGVGGYASGPLVLAAALTGRPTALQEQNSVPGFTNRVLGRFVRRAFIAFPEAAARFPAGKSLATGNPVRRAFLAGARAAAGAGAPGPGGRVLVVGGSQGARAVNDLVLGAAQEWARAGCLPALVHQTGGADAERMTGAYDAIAGPDAGLRGRIQVRPFIDDMVAAYAAADLVIARAGAMTLAELAILGKPALLIPLPTAADDHQSKNAAAFAAAGAALVLPQGDTSAVQLARTVTTLLGDPERRGAMAGAMSARARPSAAKDIVDELQALSGRKA